MRQYLEWIALFVTAGLIAVLVKYVGKQGSFILAGVAVMLPVNTFLNYLLVWNRKGDTALGPMIKGSAIGLLTLGCFLVILALLLRWMSGGYAIALAVLGWLVVTIVAVTTLLPKSQGAQAARQPEDRQCPTS